MATLSPNAIAVFVGVLILVVVAVSVTRFDVRLTRRNALFAGAISGVSGTAASIGGPFLALVLQHERPDRIRGSLAAFFLIGSSTALIALGLAGQFHTAQLWAGLTWLPFVAAGYVLARPAKARIHHDRMRRLVLGFCAIASLSVIGRALVV